MQQLKKQSKQQKTLAQASDEFIDFDGQNCEYTLEEGEACLGWDGLSRRCSCGNRRVTWETSQLADGTWYAYASAY